MKERVLALAEELAARDRWSRERLLAHQRQQLRSLIDFAVTHSDYYRDAFGSAAGRGEVRLDELPVLPKATLMAEFDRIVTDPCLRLQSIEEHLTGPDAATPFAGRYRVLATAGTTGIRGLFVYTHEEFMQWIAVVVRAVSRFGVRPDMRLVGIGAPSRLHLSRQIFVTLQGGSSSGPQLSVMSPMTEIVDTLNEWQPEAILGYPSLTGLLAEEQLAGRLRIAPKVIAVGSEVLTDEVAERIADAWGIRPNNVYAATEAPMIASASCERVGLHLSEDVLAVEVVDEANRPVSPGTPGYKVLITNLVNRAQPLIRYEISDSVTLAADVDPLGRPYRRVTAVDGRSDDTLRLPAASGGDVAIHPALLRIPFSCFPDVMQHQVIQERDGLRVRVVLRPPARRETAARIALALGSQLTAGGAAPVRIDVETVAAIEREGHGAKVKLVKRETRSPAADKLGRGPEGESMHAAGTAPQPRHRRNRESR